ncbi:MAG TPA: hypothetical protein DFR83_04485 [Deltaproteobacteria bacterium]|nr:hypothetical protein [Deltaproteobacteria bacterium]
MSWETDLQDWGDTRTAPAPTPDEAAALVAKARARKHSLLITRRVTMGSTMALAAAALLAILFQPKLGPTGWTWSPPHRVATTEPAAAEPSPMLEGTHQLQDDQLQVDAGASVVALRTGPTTRLRLDAGTVTATVSHRTGSETFSIETTSHTVTVIGTEFSVQQSPFSVRVTRGTVVVERSEDGSQWRVSAGESFINGAVERPVLSRPTPPPALPALQTMVLEGDLETARDGLTQRLQDDPTDAAAWRLLAQLEERAGDRNAAVEAWMTVVRVGSTPHAQGARYEAARLLSDQPDRVILLLTDFLKVDHPLAGEARLRLADAYAATGDAEQSRAVLEEAAKRHAGTSIGRKARRQLR